MSAPASFAAVVVGSVLFGVGILASSHWLTAAGLVVLPLAVVLGIRR